MLFPTFRRLSVLRRHYPASHFTEQILLRRIADLELEALEPLAETAAPESGTPGSVTDSARRPRTRPGGSKDTPRIKDHRYNHLEPWLPVVTDEPVSTA